MMHCVRKSICNSPQLIEELFGFVAWLAHGLRKIFIFARKESWKHQTPNHFKYTRFPHVVLNENFFKEKEVKKLYKWLLKLFHSANSSELANLSLLYFLHTTWLVHGPLWVTTEETASISDVNHCALYHFCLECNQKPRIEVGSVSPVKRSVGFESASLQFHNNASNELSHSPNVRCLKNMEDKSLVTAGWRQSWMTLRWSIQLTFIDLYNLSAKNAGRLFAHLPKKQT